MFKGNKIGNAVIKSLITLSITVILVGNILSCISRRNDAPSYIDHSSNSKAIKKWKNHQKILDEMIDGKDVALDKYIQAADFFEKTTGIPADDDYTTVGRIPGPNREEKFREWIAWFRDNRDYLYYDELNDEVKVDGNAKELNIREKE